MIVSGSQLCSLAPFNMYTVAYCVYTYIYIYVCLYIMYLGTNRHSLTHLWIFCVYIHIYTLYLCISIGTLIVHIHTSYFTDLAMSAWLSSCFTTNTIGMPSWCTTQVENPTDLPSLGSVLHAKGVSQVKPELKSWNPWSANSAMFFLQTSAGWWFGTWLLFFHDIYIYIYIYSFILILYTYM